MALLCRTAIARKLERGTATREDPCSSPTWPTAVSKPGEFRSPHFACVFQFRDEWAIGPAFPLI